MTLEQVNDLTGKIALLARELAISRDQLGQAQLHLVCSRTSEDRPLQPHGSAKVCQPCHDALRAEHAKLSMVLGSIRVVIHDRMQRGQPCPFCTQRTKHSNACYLDGNAGAQILDEYRAIEQHRDLLLQEQDRMTRVSEPPSTAGAVPRMSLKDRARFNGKA